MMVVIVSVISIGAFLVAFWLARIMPVSTGAIEVVRKGFEAMQDPALTDDTREMAMRQGSLLLLRTFTSIASRSAAALFAAILPIYMADCAGIAPSKDVFDFLSRWDVIVGASVVVGVGYYAHSKIWRKR